MIAAKPELTIEQSMDIVDRLRKSHASLSMPYLSSLYSDAADCIEALRKELLNP